MEPRPFHIDPTLGIIQVGGYGFPSGAAQTVILLSGILLTYYRNKWTWILCANYVFWISLSRVYLGVHVPTDILGGWAVGALLLALYTYARPPLEKWLEKMSLRKLFLISQLAPLLIFGSSPRFCLLGLAVGWGLCLSKYWKILLDFPESRKEFIRRAIIGVVGTFIFAYLTDNTLIQSILIGLWLSLGANLILRFPKAFPQHRL